MPLKVYLEKGSPQTRARAEGPVCSSPQWTLIPCVWVPHISNATLLVSHTSFMQMGGTTAARLCSLFHIWLATWLAGWLDESPMWLPTNPFLGHWLCLSGRGSGRQTEALTKSMLPKSPAIHTSCSVGCWPFSTSSRVVQPSTNLDGGSTSDGSELHMKDFK